MSNLATNVASSVVGLFTAPITGSSGTDYALNTIAQGMSGVPAFPINSVMTGNTAPDLLEESLALKYPAMAIYCDKLSNTLREKFRVFSGSAHVLIELRHSQDQIQKIQAALETYVTAACQILDASRGDWGNGMFYRGGYEVNFGPVKRGGRNFLQVAKIGLDVDVSA